MTSVLRTSVIPEVPDIAALLGQESPPEPSQPFLPWSCSWLVQNQGCKIQTLGEAPKHPSDPELVLHTLSLGV